MALPGALVTHAFDAYTEHSRITAAGDGQLNVPFLLRTRTAVEV